MSAPADCPGIERWQALLSAALPPDQREQCERHLETCPACQERLDRAVEGGEALLRLARAVGDPTTAPAEPALSRIVARLHDAPSPAGAGGAEAADLYFLRPSDKQGVLGLLGEYEVQEVIGVGGMGVVLKAFDPALHRLVAIKVMAAGLAGSATARRRFTREARAAAAVVHDHIVTLHGVHEADGLPYLVMQYVAGESLQARLDRAGPLEVVEAVRIGLQTASGLAAAHAQGLIHRDIKPANLLLENGLARVRITDFGLARTADDVRLTRCGEVAGTPEYMAPEQARGEPIDHRADLFSLGSVLYAMCTGLPPFRGSTTVAVLRRVSDEQSSPMRSLNPDVPAWLEEIVARLMAKDPAERFQSAAEVAALLERCLAHLREPATAPLPGLPPGPRPSPPDGRRAGGVLTRRRLLWLAAAVLLAALGLGVAFWLGGSGRGPLAFDFRRGIENLQPMGLYGPDARSLARTDAEGLRITLPADRKDCHLDVGVELPCRIRGDFDIAAGFELLAVGDPTPPAGAGVQMRLDFDSPSPLTAAVTRARKPPGNMEARQFEPVVAHGETFGAARIDQEPDGKEKLDVNNVRALQSKGRLRLIRRGSQLEYWVSDGGSPYHQIRSMPIGTDDVKSIRLFCYSGYQPVAVDIRFTDLVIDEGASGRSTGKLGLTAGLLLGLATAVLLGMGVWLQLRQRGRAEKALAYAPQGLPKPAPSAAQASGVPAQRRLLWLAAAVPLLAVFTLLAAVGLGAALLFRGGRGQTSTPTAPPAAGRLYGHTGPVHNVLFTPDGRAVSGSGWPAGDCSIRIWDPAGRKELQCISTPGQVQALALSADGRCALAGLDNGRVQYIDLETRRVIRELRGHTGVASWVGFDPDGRHAFSTALDGTARMWDLNDGSEVKRFDCAEQDGRVRAGAVSPDGSRLLTAGADESLQLWDVETGAKLKRIHIGFGWINGLQFTPDGRQAVVADREAALYDLDSGEEVRRFSGHGQDVPQATLSPDGLRLLTASWDGGVRLWDVRTGRLIRLLGRHDEWVFSAAFSPDGRLAASAGGGRRTPDDFRPGADHDIRLWDLTDPSNRP